MITVSFIARGVTWGRIQHSREEETDPRVPWVGVWRWSTYDMSADFSSFFHVSESIRSPVTMSIFICRLCLTPVGELISWIPEAEGSFSLLAPMRLLRNFFMKLMLNALYRLQSHKTSPSLHFGHSSLHDDKGTIHCPTCMGDYQQDMNGEYDRTEYNT